MVQNDEKRHKYYNFIFFEGERLARLISNVLRISKLNQEEPQVNLQYTTVATTLDLVKSKTSTMLENNNFALEQSSELDNANEIEILIDQDAFVQIAINLVDNAIKFSNEHCTEPEQRKIVIVFDHEPNKKQQISFVVRDYGPGINKEHSDRIFDVFYRAGNELTRKTQGTGIGLALVNELTISMNGKVQFSNRNPGSEFRICLPYRLKNN
jgi:signal transduction histidine kinase